MDHISIIFTICQQGSSVVNATGVVTTDRFITKTLPIEPQYRQLKFFLYTNQSRATVCPLGYLNIFPVPGHLRAIEMRDGQNQPFVRAEVQSESQQHSGTSSSSASKGNRMYCNISVQAMQQFHQLCKLCTNIWKYLQ